MMIITILIMAITFETLQQLFYIKRFNLAQDVSFFSVLKTQSYRWLIWLLLSTFLVWFSKKNASHKQKSSLVLKNAVLIFSLVFTNILIISISQIWLTNDSFSFSNLVGEYMTFFAFQKAPVYTLGYIAITIILQLYFANEKLQIQVQKLSEIKKTDSHTYNDLVKDIDEKATILNIKIGNKRKIIPVETISWIEADDYCVKVHTINNDSYTMRSSLKALEEKLSTNFLRVHRKAIVNMTMAKELNLSNSPNLILNNNIEISVSKSNLKTVKDFLS
ncbi:LytR/AlgR family response regulator transcription factor [Lacinutrix iliipiscaria]|uniref:LytR/AlgR family response regulator transcription factor n=1 Tax=Lacinutrix iliipiscaria TaxID=1230532 RepID=A0ABW5WMW9_9FLAO